MVEEEKGVVGCEQVPAAAYTEFIVLSTDESFLFTRSSSFNWYDLQEEEEEYSGINLCLSRTANTKQLH